MRILSGTQIDAIPIPIRLFIKIPSDMTVKRTSGFPSLHDVGCEFGIFRIV